MPRLKYQIFPFWSKFILFSQLSVQQVQLSKISLCHILVYMAKYPYAKNWEKPMSRYWEKCLTDGGTDRWTDEKDWFYRTSSAKMEVWSSIE